MISTRTWDDPADPMREGGKMTVEGLDARGASFLTSLAPREEYKVDSLTDPENDGPTLGFLVSDGLVEQHEGMYRLSDLGVATRKEIMGGRR